MKTRAPLGPVPRQQLAPKAPVAPTAAPVPLPATFDLSKIPIHRPDSGEPLPATVRARFEPRLGTDLSDVRVHRDSDVARWVSQLGANAATVRNHVAFAPGKYETSTPEGERMLAHEVAHGVQNARHEGTPGTCAVDVSRPPMEGAGHAPEPLSPRIDLSAIAIRRPGHELEGSGTSLPDRERGYFEARLGRSLDHVRIHHDRAAARVAARLNAPAFAVGSNIGFSSGAYAPHSPAGRRLLAHEIVHVAQNDGRPATDQVANRNNAAEEEADQVAAQLATRGIDRVSIHQHAAGIHRAPVSPPLLRRPTKAEQLPKVSPLARMTVEELDRGGSGKVLIACFVSNHGKPQLVRWALELQSIPHGESDYLWEYFVQLRHYSNDIASKFAVILENEGIAISSSAYGFPDLSHLDPRAPLAPMTPDVASTPMSKYVDNFSAASYGLDYRPARPGLLSTVLHLTYSDGAELDLDFELISDNRDPAPLQALGSMRIGAAGRMFPARLDSSTTPRLWNAKQKALGTMNASNDEFFTFVMIAHAGVMSNLPIGPVAGPEPEPEPPLTVRGSRPPPATAPDENTANVTTTAHSPTEEAAGAPTPVLVPENATFDKTPIEFTPSTGRTYKVYQRKDINWNQVRTAGDKRFVGKTNAQAALKEGLPPQLPDGTSQPSTTPSRTHEDRSTRCRRRSTTSATRNSHPYIHTAGCSTPTFPSGAGRGRCAMHFRTPSRQSTGDGGRRIEVRNERGFA